MRTRRFPRQAGPALLLVLLLGLGACSRSEVRDPFGGDRGMQRIRIEVMNLNWNDATLHALRGSERHRLGVVTGKGEAEYRMHWPVSLPLRFEIDLLAAGSCVTRELVVDPGDQVRLQIDADLSMSAGCTAR